ncbi:YgjV family protein [Algibacillus agarilyticus]|uniref:YgjV family protein n=1 Tax=Algibacillus agarilyticus TaxID=2234133 RepID=UPI001E3E6D83|nr:YgjV family protein [Algibacillus agarilyticus]
MQFDNYFYGQVLGMVSFCFGIASFYQKNDIKLKVLMMIMLACLCSHFLLLGAFTSALIASVSVVRTGLAIFYKSFKIAFVFIVISIFIGFYTAQSYLDWLPVIAACLGAYSLFCLQGIALRLGLLIGAVLWMANNFIVGSIGGTLLEATVFTVNLFTIYRLIKAQKKVEFKTPEVAIN